MGTMTRVDSHSRSGAGSHVDEWAGFVGCEVADENDRED